MNKNIQGDFRICISVPLSLIKWCLACVKQNTVVKTALNAYLLLAKSTFSDLVGEPGSSVNFGQVIEPFLVLNIYFTFFLSVVYSTFYKSTIKSNCILLLLCHVRVRSSRQELFCKKGVLRKFVNSQENACARVSLLKMRLWLVFLWILRNF